MDVSKLFKKASDAIERRNYPYAIDLLQQILALEPNHVKSRQALRATEWRITQERGMSPAVRRIMACLKGFVPLVKVVTGRFTKKNERLLIECEKFLVNDPGNLFVLKTLAAAAEALNHPDTAIAVFESVVAQDKSNVDTYRSLGRLYTKKNDIQTAQSYYQEVQRLAPQDPEAAKAIRDLAAIGSIVDGRWDETGSYQDKIKDRDGAKRLEEDGHTIRTADEVDQAIARLEKDVAAQPSAKLLVKLGELYQRKNDYPKAYATYEKALSIDKALFAATVKIGDLRLREMDEKMEPLRQKLKAESANEALRQEVVKLEQEKLFFSIEEYARRVNAYPTDLDLKFALGRFLYAAGRVDPAIAEFQQSVREPRLRVASQHQLGLCFRQKNMNDLAVTQMEKALDGLGLNDIAKEILYDLGSVYERIGNVEKAIERFKMIYEVDIHYRDVAQKLERLYKNQPKSHAS
ncbi:MAG: tetratricopeptide repeat protein [Planctomycetota bacterium]